MQRKERKTLDRADKVNTPVTVVITKTFPMNYHRKDADQTAFVCMTHETWPHSRGRKSCGHILPED
jgi:hypothetical protein